MVLLPAASHVQTCQPALPICQTTRQVQTTQRPVPCAGHTQCSMCLPVPCAACTLHQGTPAPPGQ